MKNYLAQQVRWNYYVEFDKRVENISCWISVFNRLTKMNLLKKLGSAGADKLSGLKLN
jgi:hypothetical protein